MDLAVSPVPDGLGCVLCPCLCATACARSGETDLFEAVGLPYIPPHMRSL